MVRRQMIAYYFHQRLSLAPNFGPPLKCVVAVMVIASLAGVRPPQILQNHFLLRGQIGQTSCELINIALIVKKTQDSEKMPIIGFGKIDCHLFITTVIDMDEIANREWFHFYSTHLFVSFRRGLFCRGQTPAAP